MRTIESDVVVIGSGIAGTVVAHKLAARGRKALVAEKGVWVSPECVRQVFDAQSAFFTDYVPKADVRFAYHRERRKQLPSVVGGLARFYAGVSLRMRTEEFSAWPCSYDEMEPYYSEAEQILGISGIAGVDPSEPARSQPFPHALPAPSELTQRLIEGARRAGMRPFQHPMAIRFEGCLRCNYCNQVPCPEGVKWSPDSTLRECPADRVTVLDRVRARRLEVRSENGTKRVTGILATDLRSGEEIRIVGGTYVLAGGALFTPALLKRSGIGDERSGIGANLMTHCLGLVVGVFPSPINAEGGFHKWFSVSDHYFDEAGRVRGVIQQEHLTTAHEVFRHVPRLLHKLVAFFYYRTCQLMVIAEDEPRQENRLELPASPDDDSLTIRQRFTPADLKKRDALMRHARRIMRAAGAVTTLGFAGQSVYHACGTARMGESAAESVTDRHGRVWGFDNLVICDASLFPTSSGVNPSLTVAANALRIAAHL